MKKKILAVFLSLCMAMSLLPVTALAAGDGETETQTPTESSITTEEALKEAIKAAQPGDTVKLGGNITITDPVVINKQITLDLAGNNITRETVESDDDDDMFKVSNGSLNVTGKGTIDAKKGDVFSVTGNTSANNTTPTESVLTIGPDVEIKALWNCIWIAGNGAVANVYGSLSSTGQYAVIQGNGTKNEITNNGGTVVNIYNGASVTHDGSADSAHMAIYQPQAGILNIFGGTISATQVGSTAIEVRAGELNISGNPVITGGPGEPGSDKNGNGGTTNNTAVAIAQHTTNLPITVNITGGALKGGAALYESNPQNNMEGNTNHVTITVQNATLDGAVALNGFADMGITNSTITGNVTKDASSTGSLGFVNSTIDGSVPDNSNIVYVNTSVNGTIKNEAGSNEATVNGVPYNTLANAISAANDGATVTLLKDVAVDKGEVVNNNGILKITKDITLDGNNKKITVTGEGTDTPSVINIEESADVTIKKLTIDSDGKAKHGLNLYKAGKVTVENVIIQDGTGYGIVCNSSDLTVNGLTTKGNAWGGINIDTSAGNGSNFTMTSGNIQEENSVCIENGTKREITAEISGGSFQNVMLQNVEDKVDLDITGGNFKDVLEVTKEEGENPVEKPDASDMITITGGTFKEDVSDYLADGLVQNADGSVGKPYTPPCQPQLPHRHPRR